MSGVRPGFAPPGGSATLGSGGGGGLLAARPEASAAVVGQTYFAMDAGPAGTLYACITDGAGGYDWAPIYLASDDDAEGTAAVADGSNGLRKTSADVSAMLAATDAAAALSALGGVATPRSGTLAARGSAASYPGGVYEVTSGTANGDVYVSNGTAWTLVSASREYGDDTPAMLWRLDETSSTYASTGSYSVPLTVTGSLLRTAVGYDGGTCPRFPGTAGIYAASASAVAGVGLGISNAPTALTLAAWVKPSSVAGLRSILICQYDSAYANPYYCGLAITSGALRALIVKGGAYQEITGGTVGAGFWQHVGWTYNETGDKKIRFYVDGTLLSTSSATTGGDALDLGTTSRWVVGDMPGSLAECFAGLIDAPRVYDTAQPLSWWQDVYKRGAGLYRGQ